MKNKILYSTLFVIIISIFINVFMEQKPFVFNSDITLLTGNRGEFFNTLTSDGIYNISKIDQKKSKEALESAKAIVKVLKKINNYEEIEKYFPRNDNRILGEDVNIKSMQYNKKLDLDVMLSIIVKRNISYDEIMGYEMVYSSKERYIIRAYAKNITGNWGSSEIATDGIYELNLKYEEESKMFKIDSLVLSFVNDINEYYSKVDTDERNAFKNVNSFNSVVDSYVSLGGKVNDNVSTEADYVYQKNKNSVVIINGVTDDGIYVGNETGIVIKPGVVLTSASALSKMLNNGAKRVYAIDTEENSVLVDGVISVYSEYNLVLLHLSEKVFEKIELNTTPNLDMGNTIYTISSTLGLGLVSKSGTYYSKFSEDENVLVTALPLSDGDIGAGIFDSNGNLIGINTYIQSSNNFDTSAVNYAYDSSLIKSIIQYLPINYNDIKYTKIDKFVENDKITFINRVKSNKWKKYKSQFDLQNKFPINLYSAYESKNNIVVRYKNLNEDYLSNDDIIKAYEGNLISSGYTKSKNHIYIKNNTVVKISNKFGYIILRVEGL